MNTFFLSTLILAVLQPGVLIADAESDHHSGRPIPPVGHLRSSSISHRIYQHRSLDDTANSVALPRLYMYLLCRGDKDDVNERDFERELEDFYRDLLADEFNLNESDIVSIDVGLKYATEDCHGDATQIRMQAKGGSVTLSTPEAANQLSTDKIEDRISEKDLQENYGESICDSIKSWDAKIGSKPKSWESWKYDTDKDGDKCFDLSEEAVIGIAVGTGVFVVLLVGSIMACIFCCCRRRSRRSSPNPAFDNHHPAAGYPGVSKNPDATESSDVPTPVAYPVNVGA